MYKFYKSMNENLYEFGKILIFLGVLILFGGIIYVLIIAIFYSENEINNKLDDLVSYYLAYCLITLFTGISITNKYEDHTLPKNSKKKNSLQIDVKEKN